MSNSINFKFTPDPQCESDDEPQTLGKGSLLCSILDADAKILRQVNLKARLDVATQSVQIDGKSCAMLLIPVPCREFEFDPLTQPDPETGQHYTNFSYFDDTGDSFDVDPLTLTAKMDEWIATENERELNLQCKEIFRVVDFLAPGM